MNKKTNKNKKAFKIIKQNKSKKMNKQMLF